MIGTYLTLAEAAALANLSEEEFSARAPALGILPLAWLGAILYRRADIEASMDQAWQENISAVRRVLLNALGNRLPATGAAKQGEEC